MSDRAYSIIDAATVRLGNRWIERTWSAFLGQTVELRQKENGLEWLTRRGVTWAFAVDGAPVGVMDLGEVEWSEEYNPFGAVATMRRQGKGVEITCRTMALHVHPGMLRQCRIRNVSDAPMTLSGLSTEVLPLDPKGARVYTQGFSAESAAVRWETEESAAAVMRRGGGLILGMEGGGVFELFDPDGTVCALRCPGERPLQPGEIWQTPETSIVPFTGSLNDARMGLYGEFLLTARRFRAWQRETGLA